MSDTWTGDMLDRPEAVEAFSTQLRRSIAEWAEFVARVRRDAEAMWAANPPAEYGSFEAWWRNHKVTAPFRAIQRHLEEAAKETFRLEAQHRRQRHELPAERRAAMEAKQQRQLDAGRPSTSGTTSYVRPAEREQDEPASFVDLLRRGSA